MKLAQQMQQAGRVTEATYEPPLLSGTRPRGKSQSALGSPHQDASDIENLCTCRESREWGKICAHALAVGLEYIARASAPPPVIAKTEARRERSAGPRFVETGAQPPRRSHCTSSCRRTSTPLGRRRRSCLSRNSSCGGKRVHADCAYRRTRPTPATHMISPSSALEQLSSDGARSLRCGCFRATNSCACSDHSRGHPRITFGKSARASLVRRDRSPRRACLRTAMAT